MAAIPLTEPAVRLVKRTLRARFPNDCSSHISEALAASLGFGSNIALRDFVRRVDPHDPDFRVLNESSFLARLKQLSRRSLDSNDKALVFDNLDYADPGLVVRTVSQRSGHKRLGHSRRRMAWRNAMVATINEGIRRRLFTVKPGDNRWPGSTPETNGSSQAFTFPFEIEGIPALGSVRDGGFDELSIHVAMWPSTDAARWVDCAGAGWLAGDLYASGWLERRDGAWLQTGSGSLNGIMFKCRQKRLPQVAQLNVSPDCFSDRGRFML